MKNNNIKISTTIYLLVCLMVNTAQAFIYQGELLENGIPVTGTYDLQIDMYYFVDPSDFDFTQQTEFIPGVEVENGLFTTEFGFGYGYSQYSAHNFIISVRETAVGGAYTQIGSTHYIEAVPIAETLTNNGATPGQVLKFNGFKWEPATIVSSQWRYTGNLDFDNDVAIGLLATGASHRLTVKADADDKALRLIGSQGGNLGFGARLNFGDGDFVYLEEDEDDSLALKASRIKLQSHTQQPLASNGQIKFMVTAFCSSSSSSISRQYNGVGGLNSSGASITNGTLNGTCKITFPFDVSSRFYQVSAVEDLLDINAVCQASGVELNCARHKATTGLDNGQIMIMIY